MFLLALVACASQPPGSLDRPPQIPAEVSNTDWAQDMQRFAVQDQQQPPPQRAVLFVGSSSIRLWDSLAQDFPGVAVINRGFGGSEVRDSTWYADRIVYPYHPATVVLYAGDNDLANGRTPEQVGQDTAVFIERVQKRLPKARIVIISTKPSPSRANLLDAQRQANALVQREAHQRGAVFVDVFTPMLDAQGQPRESLFIQDRLHMNAAGYAIWKQLLAPYVH
ncbi:MAG TPA: SGNH/GDSL hydrolase family protein [Pseudoxanthomonas sp.]|nr:SGNH/GDSL hydrolase family protein [Pseudoxanthomonas sp.]